MNWTLFKNSLLVAATATGLASVIGFFVALRIATAPPRWRRGLLAGAIATLALPPFLVVNHWLELFGAGGSWRHWLPFPIFTPGGTAIILALMLWPIATLLTLGTWDRLEAPQWEADSKLCGQALVRWVLWPAAQPALTMAAMLIFVLAFNQFAVPVILQVPVFSEELWLALTARLNSAGAWAAAAPMIFVPALLLATWRSRTIDWPRNVGATSPQALARPLGQRWRCAATIVTAVVLLLGFILPVGQLLVPKRTWIELPSLLKSSNAVIANSVLIAAGAAVICAALGLTLIRVSSGVARWTSWLLFFIPGVLLARTMIAVFGGTLLAGTMILVLVAFALRYFAVGWTGAALAWRSMDHQLLEVGRVDGVNGWPLLRHYAWPQLMRPVAITCYVVYLLALWDVETLVLIYPPGGETLGLRIFHMLHYGHNAQVNAMCLLLLLLALFPFAIGSVIYWATQRSK